MLSCGVNQIVVPALRTLGNIVSGDDSQTQAVVDANVLPALTGLLANSKKNIRKETCWMLSNIAAGRY
jgi:importin subunit alpha-6/7